MTGEWATGALLAKNCDAGVTQLSGLIDSPQSSRLDLSERTASTTTDLWQDLQAEFWTGCLPKVSRMTFHGSFFTRVRTFSNSQVPKPRRDAISK